MGIYPLACGEGEWLFQPIVILQQESSAYVEVVCVVLQGFVYVYFQGPTEPLAIILHQIRLGSYYGCNNRQSQRMWLVLFP